eukprot:TRINITY_DN4072_c0_g1_i4.p1 TRINITY_DN4072_c0_g1~~TRINITY_DN4072_c0_g1_i4.p1  ORF type:complete len:120 (-),score=15.50 TRINITY_DN4072_c0_g1_i4:78-437(-)
MLVLKAPTNNSTYAKLNSRQHVIAAASATSCFRAAAWRPERKSADSLLALKALQTPPRHNLWTLTVDQEKQLAISSEAAKSAWRPERKSADSLLALKALQTPPRHNLWTLTVDQEKHFK